MLSQFVDLLFRPWAAGDRFIEYLPAAMFFVLPVYALLLKLLYLRRRRFYVEHLVFGMHTHTAAFVGFTIAAAFAAVAPESWLDWARRVLVIVMLAYYFMALKHYYGDGAFVTVVKFSVLLWTYAGLLLVISAGAFIAVLLLLKGVIWGQPRKFGICSKAR